MNPYTNAEVRAICDALHACEANAEEASAALDPMRAAEACGMFLDREARCDWPRDVFAKAFEIIAARTPSRAFLAQFPAITVDVHTGGGCMGWTLDIASGEQLLITSPEGAYMPGPEDLTAGVSYYDARGEWDEVNRPDYSWSELAAFVSGFLAGKELPQ